MLNIGVLVSGGGTNLQAVIDSLAGASYARVVCVISSNPQAYALERARAARIPAYVVQKKEFPKTQAYEAEMINVFQGYNVGLVVMAGYMTILSPFFIENIGVPIINVHPSLIPAFSGVGYYGLKVHKAALEYGVKITGATVHFVDSGCDTGLIILQKAVSVQEGDTPETLQRRVMEEAEWVILPKAIEMIAKDCFQFLCGI